MNKEKITKIINNCIEIFNSEELTQEEIVVSCAQLLIKIGKALYDPENNLGDKIDWVELNRSYYTSQKLDIGLGLLLNGGQMMSIIDKNKLISIGAKND